VHAGCSSFRGVAFSPCLYRSLENGSSADHFDTERLRLDLGIALEGRQVRSRGASRSSLDRGDEDDLGGVHAIFGPIEDDGSLRLKHRDK
jgi:hypothetical protein